MKTAVSTMIKRMHLYLLSDYAFSHLLACFINISFFGHKDKNDICRLDKSC